MQKRSRAHTLLISSPVIILPILGILMLLFTFIDVPQHRLFYMATGIGLIGCGSIYGGILQLRLLNQQAPPTPWWKQYQVMMGAGQVCLGIFILSGDWLDHMPLNETLKNGLLLLLALPTFGLLIYGIILSIQFIRDRGKRPSAEP